MKNQGHGYLQKALLHMTTLNIIYFSFNIPQTSTKAPAELAQHTVFTLKKTTFTLKTFHVYLGANPFVEPQGACGNRCAFAT